MKGRALKTGFASILIVLALTLTSLLSSHVAAAGPYPYASSSDEVSAALDYLRSQQDADGRIADFATSAWAVMAIAAAGEDPANWKVSSNPSIVDYLSAHAASASATNDYSRMLLAIAAAGEDPTSFGGQDFVTLLEADYDGTQIGDSSLLNDDFWAVMALVAAGRDPMSSDAVSDSVAFILSNQGEDGGWSWGVGQDSDVDDTSAALMALMAAGQSPTSAPILDGLSYLKTMQMANGGFESWGSTNSATNSWGICGISAAGQDPTDPTWTSAEGNDPVDDLLGFQDVDGSFFWTSEESSNRSLMTSYALTALLGAPYPVAVLPPLEEVNGVSINVRIEGLNSTIWSGSVIVDESTVTDDEGVSHYLDLPTALGALEEASLAGGFSYVIKNTAYGLYVYSIGEDEPAGMTGWGFRVDYYSPMVGVADFVLDETTPPDYPHGEVLFAFSEWGEPPLRVEVDNTTPDVRETFTVAVTEYDDETGTWSPTADATVYADREEYTTGQDGTVSVAIDRDVTIEVRADKDGCVRSNRVSVVVGTGSIQPDSSQQATMTAVIVPAISFVMSQETIDFGEDLGPGDSSTPVVITVSNTGAWQLRLSAQVADEAQNLYVDGLKIDNVAWSEFSTVVPRDDAADCSVVLSVPETYQLIGRQDGTLILWASDGR